MLVPVTLDSEWVLPTKGPKWPAMASSIGW